jgi:predicted nucleotidyltransferase
MRLTPHQINTLKCLSREVFGSEVRLFLFGSRADDHRSGGDIDLYVMGFKGDFNQQLDAKIKFLTKAKLELGDQRIDVIFAPLPGQPRTPIQRIAEETGIAL